MVNTKQGPAKTTARDKLEGGKTRPVQDGESAPRLPHERDESSDSQQHQDGGTPRVGRQAHKDLERGLVDTDRGPVTDRVYNDKVKDGED